MTLEGEPKICGQDKAQLDLAMPLSVRMYINMIHATG